MEIIIRKCNLMVDLYSYPTKSYKGNLEINFVLFFFSSFYDRLSSAKVL